MPDTLILVPTAGERQILQRYLPAWSTEQVQLELCGFGPVAAAARTAFLLERLKPNQVVLAGIAGALTTDVSPGQAAMFEHIAVYGIGAGSGDTFRNAGELGWYHWTSDLPDGNAINIGDQISLRSDNTGPDDGRQLLTVCSAAASRREVRERLEKFPSAVAEDMESFSVVISCALAGIPVRVVRGMSNVAGDRDKARWRIVDALQATAQIVKELLS